MVNNNIAKIVTIATTILIASCASDNLRLLAPISHQDTITPVINVQERIDYKHIKTFSVVPAPYDKDWNNSGTRKYEMILFKLKSEMELIGYRYVDLDSSPDITVTALATNKVVQSDISSYSMNMPVYNPPSTITSNVSSSGNFNVYAKDVRGRGTYNGVSTISTEVPGYYTNQEIVVPGQVLTTILPVIKVAVYDKSKDLVWLASSVGETKTTDLSISSQLLIRKTLSEFPKGEDARYDYQTQNCGFVVATYTIDGDNFFPIVFTVIGGSPAHKAGIRQYDIITKINNISVANTSEKQLRTNPEFDFRNDNSMSVTIFRSGSLTEYIMNK